jgi:hypothetical protein
MGVTNAPGAPPSFTGAADAAGATPLAFYSTRAMSAAIAAAGTQKLFQLTRFADSHTCDVIVATSGNAGLTANCSTPGDNTQLATAFCSGTNVCGFSIWYDQSGNGQDVLQATQASMPIFKTGCVGSFFCAQGDGARELDRNPFSTINQTFTISAVVQRTGAFTTQQSFFSGNGFNVQFLFNNAANQVDIYSGNVTNFVTVADSKFNALAGIYNGGSSTIIVNGTEASNCSPFACNAAANGISGATAVITNSGNPSANPFTGYLLELGVWSGSFNSTQWAAVASNQCNYWMGNSTCSTTTPKTYVQSVGATSGTCSVCTLNWSAAVGSGHAVVGMLFWQPQSVTITSVTDGMGNTYNLGTKVNDAGGTFSTQTVSLGNITNAPSNVIVNYSAANGGWIAKVDEYSGSAALSNPTDGAANQNQSPPPGTTDGTTSGNITTTVTNDLIWSATVNISGNSMTAGTGFASRGNQGGFVFTEDKNLATAGTTAGTWTLGTTGNTITSVIAIK